MKKVYRIFAAALALSFCAAACQQENLEPSATQEESTGKTVQVLVSIGDQTRSFTDAERIKWEVGDQIKYAGGVELTSAALTADDISNDGYTASFTFEASLNEVDRTGWFCSTKCHPGNYTEVEFTLATGRDNGNVYSQTEAGIMNSDYLFLHSGTGLVSIKANETPEIAMEIAGSIFRIIPYTSVYNDEQILSVTMSSNTKIVGTVAYDRGAGTYRGVENVNWKAFNSITVSLDNPFSLEGVTSAENSKGIYMAVAATPSDTPLDGYQYVVETNKATYTFDAMDKTLAVENGVVKNVLLKLENANTKTTETGKLQYLGDLSSLETISLSADGVTDYDPDGGYWYAQVQVDGSSVWVNKDGAENIAFYENVQFEYKDKESGAAVNWLTVKYGGNGGTHWIISAQPNNGAARTAVVTASFPNVKGYTVIDDCKTKVVEITQSAAGSQKIVGYGYTTIPTAFTLNSGVETNINLGASLLTVDGAELRDWTVIYPKVQFVCVSEEDAANQKYDNPVKWLTCQYSYNANGIYDCLWWVSAESNADSETSRTAVVVALFPDDDAYQFPEPKQVVVTQKAGIDKTIYEPTSEANMWKNAEVTLSNYYAYGDNWTTLNTMLYEATSKTSYSIKLPDATNHVWQAQFFMTTNLASSSDKFYDFYCVLNSTQNVSATIKLQEDTNNDLFYFSDVCTLVAGEDYIYKMPNMRGIDISKLKLVTDFGGNPANTEITIKDIIFQEHQEAE